MNHRQIPTSKLILVLILALFIVKAVILAFLMPALQNPDEQIHYGTVEFLAEPTFKDWPIVELKKRINIGSDISTYGLSEEIIRSAKSVQFDEVKFEKQNTQDFSSTTGENEILQNNWNHYIDIYPTSVSGNKSLYYTFASWLERLFSDESIFTRMFLARLLASLFGLGIVILAYLIAKKISFSEQASLLFTTLIAFQPMFSITGAQVNIDIALVFAFSLFLYAGVSLMKDTNWKYAALIIFSAILGLFSKGPGIVLIAMMYPLFSWCAYQKLQIPKGKFLTWLAIATVAIIGLVFLIVPKNYLVSITNFAAQSKFSSPAESIGKYMGKTLGIGEFRDTTLSYWGQFGWLDSSIPEWSLDIIIVITLVGFIGTILYLFSRKEIPYLPERRYLILFLGIIIALQVAIRFYDWRVYDYTSQILIGQPGRYFLPNIIAHLLVVITGIGFLLRQENRFVLAMKVLTLAMILLQLHAIVNVIIPRYYL